MSAHRENEEPDLGAELRQEAVLDARLAGRRAEIAPDELSSDPRERAYQLSQRGQYRMISGHDFLIMLARAGVIREEDKIRRVVIDAAVEGVVVLYVERLGDERMLILETMLASAVREGGTSISVVEVGSGGSGEGQEDSTG